MSEGHNAFPRSVGLVSGKSSDHPWLLQCSTLTALIPMGGQGLLPLTLHSQYPHCLSIALQYSHSKHPLPLSPEPTKDVKSIPLDVAQVRGRQVRWFYGAVPSPFLWRVCFRSYTHIHSQSVCHVLYSWRLQIWISAHRPNTLTPLQTTSIQH